MLLLTQLSCTSWLKNLVLRSHSARLSPDEAQENHVIPEFVQTHPPNDTCLTNAERSGITPAEVAHIVRKQNGLALHLQRSPASCASSPSDLVVAYYHISNTAKQRDL